jgi:3',5'-cyclic AMP phosphodiesterase CpdA
MRTLAHLSDLHFGRVDEALLEPLITLIRSLRPDVLVVSGDLTQRAKSEQFKAARRFLDALPVPQIVVPGNHDVPLHNVFDRFFRPLVKYRRLVCDDLEPAFADGEIAVLGVNTARSATFKNGRINEAQISRLRTRLQDLAPETFKVVVTHHPFDLPEPYDEDDLVGRSDEAMAAFAACGVDLLLAGHMHASSAETTKREHKKQGYSAVAVQAGTATSVRLRTEPNSFNFIFADASRIAIQQFVCAPSEKTFSLANTRTFVRSEKGWLPIA